MIELPRITFSYKKKRGGLERPGVRCAVLAAPPPLPLEMRVIRDLEGDADLAARLTILPLDLPPKAFHG